jgi:hypothetical protein
VAGRELVFSHPEIVQLATSQFVPVAADDWYQRRRDDEEGKFFRSVADQGPRKGEGGATRQGVYCLTASGKLLAYRNPSNPDAMLVELRRALSAWEKLPAAQREPGAVSVPSQPPEEIDARYRRNPPPGALIVNVYTRVLERDADGKLVACKGGETGYEGLGAALDHLWITQAESKALVTGTRAPGETFAMPPAIIQRMARFHLVDNTRGEPDHWTPAQVRSAAVSCEVVRSDADEVRLELTGSALLSTQSDVDQSRRGYDAALAGEVWFDRRQERFTRFDLLVLGEHWGEGTFTRGARPGRTPLGIAFELADPNNPRDRVPPQGSRDLEGYLDAANGSR